MVTSTEAKARRKPRRAAGQRGAWPSRRAAGVQVLEAPAFAKLRWLVHGFSTRPGGVSCLVSLRNGEPANENVLNLGFTDWDSPEHVGANRRKFITALRAPRLELVTLRQCHSDIIHVLHEAPKKDLQGDAAITRVRGLLLGVQTADCVPILLADPKQRAVAAIHSGWRGTLQRIAGKTIGRMQIAFGTHPADVIAALGPAIGRCCYEVGPEVAREYASQVAQAPEWFDGPFDALANGDEPNPLPWLTMAPPGHAPPPPSVQLDLIAANRAILIEAGVSPKNIVLSGLCTACRTDLLFSYRRESRTGRLMAAIGLR
jgi:YfiH family protein